MNSGIKDRIELFAYWAVFVLPAHIAFILLPLGILIAPIWARRVGRAMLDNGVNAAWFNGDPRESLSAHVGDIYINGGAIPWWAKVVKWITDRFENDHVIKAAKSEAI